MRFICFAGPVFFFTNDSRPLAPVIIFSKTYCQYSKRAKGILLEKYIIEPKPYVVELDETDLGHELQDLLGAMTKRRTVPNILVAGTSIGGSDEIVKLDADKRLAAKIEKLGGGKIKAKERIVVVNSSDEDEGEEN